MTKVIRSLFILIFSLSITYSAYSQGPSDPADLTITFDTIKTCPGDLWIPVRLQNAVNLGAISLVFTYNNLVLQYLTAYNNIAPPFITGFLLVNCPNPFNSILLTWYSITPASLVNDTLLSFHFHFSGGVSPLAFDISSSSFADASGGVISPVIYQGGEVNSNTYTAVITSQPQNVNVCEGSNASVSVGVSYGVTYQWQLSTDNGTTWNNMADDATYSGVTTTTLSITNIPASANNYIVRCVITDLCTLQTNSGNSLLHVQAKPTANAGPNDTICAGSTYTLSGLGSNYNTILWTSTGSGTWIGDNTLTPVYTPSLADQAAGNVLLIMTGQGVAPCTVAKDTMILTIHSIPNASAGSDTTICIGGSATLHGSGGTSFIWNTVPPQTTQSITVSPTVNTTYFLTVSNFGCVDTTHVSVIIQTGPVVNAGNDVSICADQTVTISGTVQNVSTFMWSSTGDGSFSDPTILNPVYYPGIVDIANGSVYLVLGGLPNSPCLVGTYDSLLLTIIPLPLANAGPNVTICKGSSATLVASGGLSYTWNTIPPVTDDTLIVSPADTAKYWVTVSNSQCSAIDTVMVNVLQLPVVNISNDTMICSGDTIVIWASGGLSYLWSTGDFISSISISPLVTTTYTVTVTDIHTCRSTASVVVTVNASLNSSISPSNPSICEGGSINLTASASHPSTFIWAPGEGLSTTTGPIVIASPVKTTLYNVTATDAMGCASVSSVNLVVYQNPPVEVQPPMYDLCRGDTLVLHAYGASSYYWSPPTGLSANNLPVVLASPKNSIIYTLTGTDQHNCTTTVTASITVLPMPLPALPDSLYICRGEKYLLDGDGHMDSCTYLWQDGSTVSFTYASEPGLYYVTVNRKICSVTDTVLVKACSELWVPNAFTPNNDGINDLFYVSNTNDLVEFHLTIYNRWGERIFYTDSPYIPWDGTFDGKRCPTGVYHYVLEYLGQGNVLLEKEGKKYGHITLFR